MRRIINIIFGAALLSVISSGCTQETSVSGLSLDNVSLDMSAGDVRQLVATVYPLGIVGDIEWSSEDVAVATVDQSGVVTAVAIGETVISVSCEGYEARCFVNVKENGIEEIALNKGELKLLKGDSEQLRVVVTPAGVEASLVWMSSDPEIASVQQDGTVKGMNPGSAEISVHAGGKSAVCTVEVSGIPVESVSLNIESAELEVGDALGLSADILPVFSDYTDVEWNSSAEGVATVSNEGVVEAKSAGSALITVSVSGYTAQCNVTVVNDRECKVGDIYYSDGSYSEYPDPNKEAIGVIFWTEDPSIDDPTLRKDHPECINGLVVGLKEYSDNFQQNYETYHKSVGEWVVKNRPDLQDTRVAQDPENENNYYNNIIVGYNNTKAYEAFNAAPENTDYPLTFIDEMQAFRETVPAPSNTSGWYLPSAKELAILRTGNSEYNINTISGIPDPVNMEIVNSKIRLIDGALELRNVGGHYSSSTEFDWETNFATIMDNGAVLRSKKVTSPASLLRFVLAF